MSAATPGQVRIRSATTGELSADEIVALRVLLESAFPTGDDVFTEADWQHAAGGRHFLAELDGVIIGHASVVAREIHVGTRRLRAGYVEAVAVDPFRQRRGVGTRLMREVTTHVRDAYELGALGTGAHTFYKRLGWRTWRGPSAVRTRGGVLPTPDEDGFILVLETPRTPRLDPSAQISCDWRPGDVW